jgi:hypothetical protein
VGSGVERGVEVSGLGVGCHVLDDARFAALHLRDLVFVVGGAGVYIERFIDSGGEVGLRGLTREIGAGDANLQRLILRCRGDDVEVFRVH